MMVIAGRAGTIHLIRDEAGGGARIRVANSEQYPVRLPAVRYSP